MPLNQQVSINISNATVELSVNIINIHEDTLKLTLQGKIEKIRKSRNWNDIFGSLGLIVTCIAAFGAEYQEGEVLPLNIFNIIFLISLAFGVTDLVRSIRNREKEQITAESIVEEIKKQMSESPYIKKTEPKMPQISNPQPVVTSGSKAKRKKKRR